MYPPCQTNSPTCKGRTEPQINFSIFFRTLVSEFYIMVTFQWTETPSHYCLLSGQLPTFPCWKMTALPLCPLSFFFFKTMYFQLGTYQLTQFQRYPFYRNYKEFCKIPFTIQKLNCLYYSQSSMQIEKKQILPLKFT